MELYNILKYNGSFLEIVQKDVPEIELSKHGLQEREIFKNDIVVGYVLLKGTHKLYAIKDCK